MRRPTRESPTFMSELVLLPGPRFGSVPRRGTKAILFDEGHIISALEFHISWDEERVVEVIKDSFAQKLCGSGYVLLITIHLYVCVAALNIKMTFHVH